MPTPDTATLASPARRRLLGGDASSPAMARQPTATAAATAAGSPPAPVRWLNKAGFGCTRADLDAFQTLGGSDAARWAAWINQQLDPAGINDSACEARLASANLTTLDKTLPQLWADHHENEDWRTRMLPLAETECATLIRALWSRRQLFERLVGFWHDHFSVYGNDGDSGPVMVHYDRDVIRANALGNFRTMLGAVARSPAMLYYLDNVANRGHNYNENYARELMELHTLGVENYYGPTDPWEVPCTAIREVHCEGTMPAGFVDNDIYEAAAALTGWTVKNGHWQYPNQNDGTFVYHAEWHDHRNKLFLGLWMPADQPPLADGEVVFDRLCQHPGTARHVAGKMCRRFVGENVSQTLIDTVATAFIDHAADANQIALMLRTVLESDEFKATWGDGMKRPLESTVAALRVLGADFTPVPDATATWTVTEEFLSRLGQTGHRPFRWVPPNGFPDTLRAWSSSGALGMTLRLLSQLPEFPLYRGEDAPRLADLVGQTMAAITDPNQRTATNIIAFWCGQILGYQPQPLTAVVTAFMQQNADVDEPLELDTDAWHTGDLKRHYVQQRLRTAVGMLLMNPEFLQR